MEFQYYRPEFVPAFGFLFLKFANVFFDAVLCYEFVVTSTMIGLSNAVATVCCLICTAVFHQGSKWMPTISAAVEI